MSIRFDGAVLVLATLAAFSATFFAVLLLLGGEPTQAQHPEAYPVTANTFEPPAVSAAPPAGVNDSELEAAVHTEAAMNMEPAVHQEPAVHRYGSARAKEVLDSLGVLCAEGVECYQD